jgi:hypothetical protein
MGHTKREAPETRKCRFAKTSPPSFQSGRGSTYGITRLIGACYVDPPEVCIENPTTLRQHLGGDEFCMGILVIRLFVRLSGAPTDCHLYGRGNSTRVKQQPYRCGTSHLS